MSIRTHARWVAAGLLLALTSGCISIEGESSGEQKQRLESSFLFRSADIFFPGGRADPGAGWAGGASLGELDRSLNAYDDGVRAMHAANRELLSKVLEQALPADVRTRVTVLNTGKPVAQVDGHGAISIDATVARSLFRTAVVAGVRDGGLGGFRFMDEDVKRFGKHAESEQDAIEQFLAVKRAVEQAKGRSIFGDMAEVLRDDDDVGNGSWEKMTQLSEMSAVVERHYSGPILFMLAHETGHVVLGHAERRRTMKPGDCAGLRAMEDEADLYATLLLSLTLARSGALGWGDFDALTGFEDFFDLTYEMAGFDASGADAACTHPPVAQRLAHARETLAQVQDEVNDEFDRALANAIANAQGAK